jgi:hypothetical protein
LPHCTLYIFFFGKILKEQVLKIVSILLLEIGKALEL